MNPALRRLLEALCENRAFAKAYAEALRGIVCRDRAAIPEADPADVALWCHLATEEETVEAALATMGGRRPPC
jgi:hypothetical protein